MLRIIESGQLIWNIEGIATGCLSKKVITHLLNFVQKGRYAHESGGVLLGILIQIQMDYLLKMQHFRVQEIVLRGLAFIEVLDIKKMLKAG